jgi:hypothetical protein
MALQPLPSEFLIYEENFVYIFISVVTETVITTYKRTAAAIATSLFLNSSYFSTTQKHRGREAEYVGI